VLVVYEKEQTQKTYLHDINTGKQLIQGVGVKPTASVMVRNHDIQQVVAENYPEESEGNDAENNYQRCYNGIDDTWRRSVMKCRSDH